jgi:protein-S-isoprenylcysteine O-methyltransferase Ste14
MKLLSIFGYLAMVLGLFALIMMRSLFSPLWVVIALQTLGTALMIWARVTFGRRSFHLAANPTEGGLVTTGPYRFIRHPIYTGVCLLVVGLLGAYPGWRTVLAVGSVFVGILIRIFSEEALVIQRYPEYLQYSARTWRMVPYVF